jgi:hypothetical protein
MAYTPEQLATLNAVYDALPDSVKGLFNSASTQDTASAIADIISQRRRQSMSDTVAALVTGSVSNWASLEAASAVADSATLYPAMDAFQEALAAHNASLLVAHAVTIAFAAQKNFRG